MALLTQEASLRSTRIDYRRLEPGVLARLEMSDGSYFHVYKDDHNLLKVQLMPPAFREEVFEKLLTGQGSYRPLTGEQMERVVFRIPRVHIGDKIWMQSFVDGTFFRVFHPTGEVADLTLLPPSGRIPRQR